MESGNKLLCAYKNVRRELDNYAATVKKQIHICVDTNDVAAVNELMKYNTQLRELYADIDKAEHIIKVLEKSGILPENKVNAVSEQTVVEDIETLYASELEEILLSQKVSVVNRYVRGVKIGGGAMVKLSTATDLLVYFGALLFKAKPELVASLAKAGKSLTATKKKATIATFVVNVPADYTDSYTPIPNSAYFVYNRESFDKKLDCVRAMVDYLDDIREEDVTILFVPNEKRRAKLKHKV